MKYVNRVLADLEDKEADAGKPEQSAIEKWLDAKGGSFGKQGYPAWTQGDLVYSYNTVIGKIKGDRVYVNDTKYSSTTSRLQGFLKMAAKQHGYEVEEKDEAFFKTSMPHKVEPGSYKKKSA